MDEERVLAVIDEADCEPSSVGLAEYLRSFDTLATGRVSRSSEASSRAFEVLRSDACP